MDIIYAVGPTEKIYQGRDQARSFLGIRIDFLMRMSVPPKQDAIKFALAVLPPKKFTVEYNRFGRYTADGGPSDSEVYDVMAARAFDEFGTKLEGVFFKGEGQVVVTTGDDPQ
jgi:hypothetical protein